MRVQLSSVFAALAVAAAITLAATPAAARGVTPGSLQSFHVGVSSLSWVRLFALSLPEIGRKGARRAPGIAGTRAVGKLGR